MGIKKITIEDMHKIAKSKGGKCLSKKYINTNTKLKWQCEKGHIWKARPTNIKHQKNWCSACYNENKRLTIEDMHKLAKSKGFKCLSKKYINVMKKLKWQCKKGHIWKTTPNRIQQGSRCPVCNNENKKLTIKEMKKFAELKKGKCLSKKYINNYTKLKWQCEKGHIWKAIPNSIQQGSWCPVCQHEKEKLTIKYVYKFAKSKSWECLSKKYINNRTKLKWQCKKGHIWEAPLSNMQRETSQCPICYNENRNSEIEDMHKLAELKRGKCLSKKYINAMTKLKWQCKKGHIWKATPNTIQQGNWCTACNKKTIKEMKKLAESKGGKCLSKKYINTNTKLKWQCEKGHIWKATPSGIQRETWCPVCKISKGENKIRKFLKQKNILFEEQKIFKECRNKRPLPFDFFIINKNILIEFDGAFHYIDIFGGLKKQQMRDEIKNKFCKDNDIKLIRIPYWEKDNIEQILKENIT